MHTEILTLGILMPTGDLLLETLMLAIEGILMPDDLHPGRSAGIFTPEIPTLKGDHLLGTHIAKDATHMPGKLQEESLKVTILDVENH